MLSYKTIVVHIDGGPEQPSRLQAAALLANEHGAHLVGSAVTGTSWPAYVLLTGSIGAPQPQPASDFQGLRNTAELRLDVFRQEAARLGVASRETRLIEDDARHGLLLQSRYADLLVLSQDERPRPGEPESAAGLAGREHGLPEFLALRGVRPVLVVPPDYAGQPIPGTALVGWDGGMQALRAIDAAMPLLRRAAVVRLALVNPDQLSDLHGEDPGADAALWLARHGVQVEVEVERTHATAGAALAALARDCGAGLMVTGAYGHSRYREWMLGGVTRELLERAPVPLLIAH
jgi:nucleotide-binding universal stress UspA family protein